MTVANTPRSKRKRRILICGINYWPEETGIAPYTTGMAEHFARQGNDVTVFTGMPYYPSWTVPDGYAHKLTSSEARNGVVIKRLRQYVPTRQSALRRAMVEASFMANIGRLIGQDRPDLIIGIIPSVCGGALASVASTVFRAPYGIIVQDLSGQAALQTGIRGGGRVAKLTSAIESRILRRAAAVGIIAEGFKPHVLNMGVAEKRILRIRNWTHIDRPSRDRREVRASLGLGEEDWVALHAGNMGLKQGLENVVEAARVAHDAGENVTFVLVGDGNQRQHLTNLAQDLPNVRFFPPQPEREFADVLAAADVLLVNQKPTVVDMCLPGKLTSYLAVERPVVAAVASNSDTAIELERAQAGLVIQPGDPHALIASIRLLRADPSMARSIAARGKAFADESLTAERALAALDHFMEKVDGGRSDSTPMSDEAAMQAASE